MDWSFIAVVIQLIFLEGILSLDNAAVLGALVSGLPDDKPVPWPVLLRKPGALFNRFLGSQRGAALRVGLPIAYLGRGAMLYIAALIIHNPWLKILGAIYLVRLAVVNLANENAEDEPNGQPQAFNADSFWKVVLTVEMTDLVFSLDNVVAAVTLSGKFWVVMLGVALGILGMRFAAGLFSYAVQREPVLKNAAYLLVLIIGLELLFSEISGQAIDDWLRFAISAGTILLCLIYAHLPFRASLRPLIAGARHAFSHINALASWLLDPFSCLLRWLFGAGKALARRLMPTQDRAGE